MEAFFANKYGWLISMYLYTKKNELEEHLLIPMVRDGIFIAHC